MFEPLTTEKLRLIVAPLAEEYSIDRVCLYNRRFCENGCLCGFCVHPTDGCGVFQLSGFSRKLEEALGPLEVVCEGSARHSILQRGSVQWNSFTRNGRPRNPLKSTTSPSP